MAETPKTDARKPDRRLSEQESRDRQDDLDKALKLYGKVSSDVSAALPMLERAAASADELRQMCDRNPVLRAAMVSRRLAVQVVGKDVRHLHSKASTIAQSVSKAAHARRDELEEAVRDPELLR